MSAEVENAGWDAVQIAPTDHVAVALSDLTGAARVRQGEHVVLVALRDAIPLGHKFALTDLPAGSDVLKYGAPIGRLIVSVTSGEHVHVHNLKSQRAAPRS